VGATKPRELDQPERKRNYLLLERQKKEKRKKKKEKEKERPRLCTFCDIELQTVLGGWL
jgi:hypothetical protein